jgi:hypothetical protein
MHKIFVVLALSLAGLPALADEVAPSMTPEQARSQWQSMTPDQQAAAKSYMKSEALTKQANWNAMSADEQQAKKDAARSKLEPYAQQAQAQMQERMTVMKSHMQERMSGMGGGGGMMGRPFGSRGR